MSIWIIMQICCNILFLGLIVWLKRSFLVTRDSQQTRDSELLQAKIAVLEDLSDRTEVQVKQLTALMDKKAQKLKEVIHKAQMECAHVEQEREKSLEVAEIFKDKIPYDEVIERQKRIQYIKAAQMAYRGLSKEEISKEVTVPEGELELIMKVHKGVSSPEGPEST